MNVYRRTRLLALLFAGWLPMGCIGSDQKPSVTEIQELRDKIEAQQRQLVTKDEQINEQAKHIQELQGLTGERAMDKLVHVARIEIERLSGGYDDNHDGIDEGVVVYLRLYDRDGDAIKAAGAAHVRLLDLANPLEKQLIGEVRLDPEALHPMWYGRLTTSHYTIRVPWVGSATRAEHKTITVQVEFTELLTGSAFEAQTVVQVAGTGGGTSAQLGP